MKVRALIFDLDGTLLDSLGDIGGAMNDALKEKGLPQHPIPSYLRMVGDGIETLARRAVADTSQPVDVDDLVKVYRARYRERMEQETRPYDGISQMLDGLEAKQIPTAVLSNKRDDFTVELVRRQLGRWRFVDVRGEREGVPRKPDPQAALQIAEALKVPPGEIAFVGDTPIDMKTAVAAGMLPVAVMWGFRGHEELNAAGAKHVLAHPRELLDFV